MERLCIVGTSWRTGGMEQIARLTLPVAERDERLGRFAQAYGLQELLYLATCNRVELACVLAPGVDVERVLPSLLEGVAELCSGDDPTPPELDLDCRLGEQAVRHLFSVAAGLESAQPGEHEIRGQLRRSLSDGSEAGHSGPLLTDLVNSALLAARRIHRKALDDQQCPASLARVALELVQERCAALDTEDRRPGRAPVGLFGVSPITIQCAHRLVRDGRPVVIVNRSPERAAELVRELEGAREFRACDSETGIDARAMTFEEFGADPRPLAAAISATAARGTVLDADCLRRLADASAVFGGSLRFIDMAVPADIDADDAEAVGIERIGMSALNELAQEQSAARQDALRRAAETLDGEVRRFQKRRSEQTLGHVLRGIGDQTRDTLRTGLDEVIGCRLQELDKANCGMLDEWARRMAQRVSHVPFAGLRALAAEHGPEAVETFLAAADPGLVHAYRAALDAGEPDLLDGPSVDDLAGSGEPH